MTTRLGHLLRKKFYPRRMFWNYCIKRYAREQAEAQKCDCKKKRQRCGHPGDRKPPPVKSQPHPPEPPKSGPPRELCNASCPDGSHVHAPEHVELGWEYAEKAPKPCRRCKGLREDYAAKCKQMKPNCPTCGRGEGKNGRRNGRCADNWYSGDCSIVYF